MKPAKWVCWIADFIFPASFGALLTRVVCSLALLGPLPVLAQDDEVATTARIVLTQATVTLTPFGRPTQAPIELTLPHRWDKNFPGQGGHALYQMTLPPTRAIEPLALFIPRVGNQVEVRVSGQVVARLGILGDAASDWAKGPTWITIPASLVNPDKPTALDIEVTTQADRWGGLSNVHFGPESVVQPVWRSNYNWRQTASVVIVLALALVGVIAAGLWWRQRDAGAATMGDKQTEGLYGMFALIALFGIVRMGDRLLPVPPLPWPLWGGVTAAAFAAHILLMARFCLETVGERTPWVRTGFWLFLAASVIAALAAFLLHQPSLWTWTLAACTLPGLVVLYQVVRHTWLERSRENLLMCIAGVLVILAGVRDLVQVRIADSGSLTFSIMPHAVFVLVMIMGWIIVERYSQQVRQFRDLNVSLEHRIFEREQQLGASYDRLKIQNEERATLQERQRIMRDIHDGVGAQLVGLLSLLKKDGSRSEALQEHANAALDELRMAVDSLQPVNGDLTTVLASLRYRLQPRLDAAGLAVVWDVPELPLQEHLPPGTVLQIQRILLEAFTNVLRHARASEIQIHARAQTDPTRLVLVVQDNGIGLDTAKLDDSSDHGHGLRNMKQRAQAIGGKLVCTNLPTGGTRVQLELPLH